MSITELQVLEARLLLAQANREYYFGKNNYDLLSEAHRELKLANDARVEYLKGQDND